MIHSLSGNLHYHHEIKRRGEGWGGWNDEALQPSRLSLLRAPESSHHARRRSLDGLCIKRESEGRAALGTLKREDYAWTVTLTTTRPPGYASRRTEVSCRGWWESSGSSAWQPALHLSLLPATSDSLPTTIWSKAFFTANKVCCVPVTSGNTDVESKYRDVVHINVTFKWNLQWSFMKWNELKVATRSSACQEARQETAWGPKSMGTSWRADKLRVTDVAEKVCSDVGCMIFVRSWDCHWRKMERRCLPPSENRDKKRGRKTSVSGTDNDH